MKVTFNINFHTVWGQKLCVVGSIPELGSWEPALAKEMSYNRCLRGSTICVPDVPMGHVAK